MQAIAFPEANANFCAPSGYDEKQVKTIPAYMGTVARGSCEGARLVVVAHQPSAAELADLNEGKPIFLSCLGGLPAHFMTTRFEQATTPA